MNDIQYYKENNDLFKIFMDGMILDSFKDIYHPSHNATNFEILIPEYSNECMRYVSNNVIKESSKENVELDIQKFYDNTKSIFSYIQQNLFALHSLTINGLNLFTSRYGNVFFNLFKESSLCDRRIIQYLTIKTTPEFPENKDNVINLIKFLESKGVNVSLEFYIYNDALWYCKDIDFLMKNDIKYVFNLAITPENVDDFYSVYFGYKTRVISYCRRDDISLFVNFFEKISAKWDKKKIGKYINFLEIIWQDMFFEEKPIEIIDNLYIFDKCNLLKLTPHLDKFSCGFQDTLYIRSTDLAILGCPHLKDNHQIYGYIDGKDIKTYNTEFCIAMYSANPASVNMECGFCKYNKICPKQCPAAQYEWSGEPFLSIPETCDLFKAKIQFLTNKYKETGILNALEGSCLEECFQVKAIINEIDNWIE